MNQTNARGNRSASPLRYGTKHAAAMADIDPSTARDYVRRGVVTPEKTSTGRLVWSLEDIAVMRLYRARLGGGASA